MERNDINALLTAYLNGTCTDAERRLVEYHFLHYVDQTKDMPTEAEVENSYWETYRNIRPHIQGQNTVKHRMLRILPYAAAALIVVTAIAWMFFGDDYRHSGLDSILTSADIAPGGNRAVLTLADGRTVDLSEAQTGIIIGDGITYLDGSSVLGENASTGARGELHKLTPSQTHTLTTPKGGTYQITLPDGSRIWLNAGSTLTYPSRFDGNERVVELEGEAYFDISEQWSVVGGQSLCALGEKIPFLVKTSTQTVEVLGTEFNISAYPDESETKTTLVTGLVRVVPTTDHRSPITIKPGQQATAWLPDGGQTAIVINDVDVTRYTSWREGLIVLEQQTLPEILRQLARWYDVEFISEVPLPVTATLSGEIPRTISLSGLLKALEDQTSLQFTIQEGRRVMISY